MKLMASFNAFRFNRMRSVLLNFYFLQSFICLLFVHTLYVCVIIAYVYATADLTVGILYISIYTIYIYM